MGLEVTVTNYSDLAWTRNNWDVGAGLDDGVSWADEITQVPATQLDAGDGQATAAVNSEHATFIFEDALWMVVGYGSTAGNFAVRLQQYAHGLGMGPQSAWCYWDDTQQAWTSNTTDTTPVTWTLGAYQVLVTPTLSDSAGSIAIIIPAVSQA